MRCHDLISLALEPTAHSTLKRQALANLRMLLTADEERHRTHSLSYPDSHLSPNPNSGGKP